MRIAILIDDVKDNAKKWKLACEKKQIHYKVFNLLQNEALTQINEFKPHFCLVKPPGDILHNKLLFDKKLSLLHEKKIITYPSLKEVLIYENKEALNQFLIENNLPCANTNIIKNKVAAMEFSNHTNFPIVVKTLIGASGSGVKIIKSKQKLVDYINLAFNDGLKRKVGPNRKAGGPLKWTFKAVKSPRLLLKKLKLYYRVSKEKQHGIVFLQEFIPHNYEWRIVKIGDSFFGYKKINVSDLASGSKKFEYGAPPREILDLTKDICKQFNFNFMAIDYIPHEKIYLINEMQTLFGHANPYICKVNNQPGRYLFKNNNWVFEEGHFNSNESFDLRLETAIELYKKSLNKA